MGKTEKDIDKVEEKGGELKRNRPLQIFDSFEALNNHERREMAKLTSQELLQNLRKYINIAYGMYGYDPLNLPAQHKITIIDYSDLP